jgi:hypothetical protein
VLELRAIIGVLDAFDVTGGGGPVLGRRRNVGTLGLAVGVRRRGGGAAGDAEDEADQRGGAAARDDEDRAIHGGDTCERGRDDGGGRRDDSQALAG